MRSKLSQSRAARPMPPYTTRSCGRSATCGSRLFMIMRSGASVSQLLALISGPRGARMMRAESERFMNTSPPDACVQRVESHAIDELSGLFDVPDGEIATLAGFQRADGGQAAQRARRFARNGGDAFLHGEAKQRGS